MTTTEPNLYQRLLAVQADIDAVEKGGTNTAQGYDYVRATDVASAVRKALIKHGVYCSTSLNSDRVPIVIERPNKSPIIYATVDGVMNFINVDDPNERTAVSIVGHGLNYGGDKGIYAAITGAIKYGLRTAFLIPDENDPEVPEVEITHIVPGNLAPATTVLPVLVGQPPTPRADEPKVASMATDRQKAMIRAEARKVGLDGDAFKAFVAMTTGKTTSKDLEIGDIDIVLTKIKDAELVEQFATATYGESL